MLYYLLLGIMILFRCGICNRSEESGGGKGVVGRVDVGVGGGGEKKKTRAAGYYTSGWR